MLDELKGLMRSEVARLIQDPTTPWQTLDVLYEVPRVERVWVQLGSKRLYLHRIHSCEKPFFHPHPWPSAIFLLSGQQRMALGYGPSDGPPPEVAATFELRGGAGYEMTNPKGWHSVQPFGPTPSYSLMLTDRPWTTHVTAAQKSANQPLSEEVKKAILEEFLAVLRMWSPRA